MLRVDLWPVLTVVRETTKGQVRHRLRGQQKSTRFFIGKQCSFNLKSAKIAIFFERKKWKLTKNIRSAII